MSNRNEELMISMSGKKVLLLAVGLLALVAVAGVFVFGKSAPAFASDASPVMYFYSDTCSFCLKQKPILEELAKDGYRVKLMDVRANPTYWQTYQVTGTPTFLSKGGERLSGLQDKETLRAFLDRSGAKIPAA